MLLQESIVLRRTGGPLGSGPVSTKPRLERKRAQFVKEAHDDYLASIVERGPLGLFGFVLLLVGVNVRVVGMARQRLADGFSAVVIRPHALVGAVAGTAVAMAVYELLHLRHVWAMFALVAAVAIWGRR
jgi:O-antigen ligase